MALINPNAVGGTGFGLSGLISGLQLATGQSSYAGADEVVRQGLTRDYEQNILQTLLSRGANTPQAIANLSMNTPFANLGLSRLGSAIGAQQALAPQAIGAAMNGRPGMLNNLNNFFGNNGAISNPLGGLPLAGGGGLSALLNLSQSAAPQAALLGSLNPVRAELPNTANRQAGTPSFGANFGDLNPYGLYSDTRGNATREAFSY